MNTRKNRRNQLRMRGGLDKTKTKTNKTQQESVEPHLGPFGYAASLAKSAVTGVAGYIANKAARGLCEKIEDTNKPNETLAVETPGMLSNLGNKLTEGIESGIESIGATQILENAKGVATNALGSVTGVATNAFDSVKGVATNALGSVTGVATNALDSVKGVATNALDTAKDAAKDAAASAATIVEEGSVNAIEGLNKTVEVSGIEETIPQAVGNTVEIAKDVLEDVNKKLEDPEFKKDIQETVSNVASTVADNASTVLEAADKPITELIDKSVDMGEKLGEKLATAGVDIALKAAMAVPGAGSVIAGISAVDKIVQTGFAVVDAGVTGVKLGAEATTGILSEIKEKASEAGETLSRAADKIGEFKSTDEIVKTQTGGRRGSKNTKKTRYTTRYLTRRRRWRKM